MAPGVLKTFKKEYKQALYELLEFTDFISFVNFDKLTKEIDKLTSIEFDIGIFASFYKESTEVFRALEEKRSNYFNKAPESMKKYSVEYANILDIPNVMVFENGKLKMIYNIQDNDYDVKKTVEFINSIKINEGDNIND